MMLGGASKRHDSTHLLCPPGVAVQGFVYRDSLRPIAELDGAGNVVSRFVYGTGKNVPDYMVKGSSTYRLVTDHLGSVRLVVDATTGTIVQEMSYDEFGRVLSDTGGRTPKAVVDVREPVPDGLEAGPEGSDGLAGPRGIRPLKPARANPSLPLGQLHDLHDVGDDLVGWQVWSNPRPVDEPR